MERQTSDESMDKLTEGLSDWSGDDDDAWYFDLPDGAWQRQEQKNRELRENVRQNIRTQNEAEAVAAKKDPFRGKPDATEPGEWTLNPGAAEPGGPASWSPPPLRPRSRTKEPDAAEGFGWARTSGGFADEAAPGNTTAAGQTDDGAEVLHAMKAWSSDGQARRRVILGGGATITPREAPASTERWDFSGRKGSPEADWAPAHPAPPLRTVPAIANTWMVEDEPEHATGRVESAYALPEDDPASAGVAPPQPFGAIRPPEPAPVPWALSQPAEIPEEEPGRPSGEIGGPAMSTAAPGALPQLSTSAWTPEDHPGAPLEATGDVSGPDGRDDPALDYGRILTLPLKPSRQVELEDQAQDPNRPPSRWDDMFAQPVGDSIVDAMRHWQEQVREEEARARDVTLLPPELLQPFDWEQTSANVPGEDAANESPGDEPERAPRSWAAHDVPVLNDLLPAPLQAVIQPPPPPLVSREPQPNDRPTEAAVAGGWEALSPAPQQATHAIVHDSPDAANAAVATPLAPQDLTSAWGIDEEDPLGMNRSATNDRGLETLAKPKSGGLLSKLFARGQKSGDWVAPEDDDWKAPRLPQTEPGVWPAAEPGAAPAHARGPNAAASDWAVTHGEPAQDPLQDEPVGSWHGLRPRAVAGSVVHEPALPSPSPGESEPVASFDDETGRLVYDLPRRFTASADWDDAWLEAHAEESVPATAPASRAVTKLETMNQDPAISSVETADSAAHSPHPEDVEGLVSPSEPNGEDEAMSEGSTEPTVSAPVAIRSGAADPWATFLKVHERDSGDAFAFSSDRANRRAS